MSSSLKVQMLTLCSNLDSETVYINTPKSLSALEGCFKEKRRPMFHSPAYVVVVATTLNELIVELKCQKISRLFTVGIL